MTAGIDTKTDPKQVQGKVAVLENATFVSPKEIKKRNGYSSLANVAQGAGLASFKNELLSFDGRSLYSYSQAANQFFKKGSLVNMKITSAPVVRNANRQLVQDSAVHSSGLQVFTWEDSAGSIRYSLIDSTTNQQITSNAVIGTGVKPKPVVLGNYFVILFLAFCSLLSITFS